MLERAKRFSIPIDVDAVVEGRSRLSYDQALCLYHEASLHDLGRWSSVRIRRGETLVRIHGDVAWAHFLWDGEGVTNGEKYRLDGERWTIVMVWEEGAWRLAQMHTSMPYRDWASHRVGGSV